jgi:uncharacterized protein YraI
LKHQRFSLLWLAIIITLACNFPSFNPPVAEPSATASLAAPSVTGSPTATSAAGTSTFPLASPNAQAVNCRSGPATNWPVVVVLNPGQTVEIVGHNAAGTWWYVKNPVVAGTFCWMSKAFTTTSGDLNGVPLVAEPPTLAAPPTIAAGDVVVTNVTVSVQPETIHVGGCMGPIQPSTITATITDNGSVKLEWHFVTEQNGALPIHSLNFNKAGDKDVSASFTPPLTPGTYSVEIVIDGMNLSGMKSSDTYKITC